MNCISCYTMYSIKGNFRKEFLEQFSTDSILIFGKGKVKPFFGPNGQYAWCLLPVSMT